MTHVFGIDVVLIEDVTEAIFDFGENVEDGVVGADRRSGQMVIISSERCEKGGLNGEEKDEPAYVNSVDGESRDDRFGRVGESDGS
jgi:hypothetical protein